ncbi:MAG TPA: AbrB family transcriptional regulator [Gammaproteobacteria bacterium]|nr:AbrB family transcriptional regulator [Gammaproteobacteria bacterium]
MQTVTIFPEYQVVIPREMIDRLALQPGQKLKIEQFENRIELSPLDSLRNKQDEDIDRIMQEAQGFLKGIDTTIKLER